MAAMLLATAFAAFLVERWRAGDGYIMGATGQNPAKWEKGSWWFRQYRGSQKTKALYWRSHARRVWDCQGLSEGYINERTSSKIDVRARNNYASWCNPKGKGVIPAQYRVPGAAVFKAYKIGGLIHHVGYLVEPVNPLNPSGDWYIIEAKGVMYGVIRSKLSDGGWNRWGLMTKYFEYTTVPETIPVTVIAPAEPAEPYNCNWLVAVSPVNVRKGPDTKYSKRLTLAAGEALMYDGAVDGEWYAVDVQGKRCWVSSRYVKLVVREKPMLDISKYNKVKDWNKLAKRVSFLWIRVGYRSLTSGGKLVKDPKFEANAKAANAAGIPWGAYFYGRGKTAGQGAAEAAQAVAWAEPYGPTVYAYDVEVSTNTQTAVQTFVDVAKLKSGKPCGTYIGRRWSQVKADKLIRDYQWSPYYNTGKKGPSWLLFHGKNPSHPHDFHQYSPSFILAGAVYGVDVSHVNDDPKTTYKGRSIRWLRTGGKES